MSAFNLKYFGLIAEMTGVAEELFSLDQIASVHQLKTVLLEKYPSLSTVHFVLAVNQKIATDEVIINAHDELALLPPFAGG